MTAGVDIPIRLDRGKLDLRRGSIERDDGRVPLTTKEVELLRYLVARASEDVPREELLTEVWGYAATTVTRAVDTAVKRLRKKLEQDPANPRHLISVHGVGYRFEASGREPSMVLRPRRPVVSAVTPSVPADGDSFVGRGAAMSEVASGFAEGRRLVTIRGPSGVGKSRLAREVARRYDAPVAYLALAGVDVEGLPRSLADALGAESESDAALVEALQARGRLLVLLDDVDAMVEAVARQTRRVLHACPELVILVTGRARLGVPEEQVVTLEPLTREAAVALFVDRAGSDLDPADEGLPALVDALDRLPLALELAAPRARVLSPSQLRERLDQRFRVLARRRGSDQPGLEEALAYSWELLDPDERAVLEACSVFRGGFSAEAAEAVAEPEDPGAWVIDLLESLEEKSMIHRRALPGGGTRLDLLASVRAFAEARARESGREEAAAERHQGFFVALGEQLLAALYGPDVRRAAVRMGLERRNLVRAWSLASTGELRARLALVLGTQGVHASTLESTSAILDATSLAGLAPRLEASLRVARATALVARNRFEAAREEASRAADLVDVATDPDQWLDAQRLLGGLAADGGDLGEGVRVLGAARQRASAEPTAARLRLLGREAMFRFHHGEVDASEELIGELLAGALASRSLFYECDAYRLRAGLALRRSRLDDALADATRAREGFVAIGDRWREALCHELLGAVASYGGKHDLAEEEHGAAVRLYRSLGRRHELPRALGNLARAYVHQQKLGPAREAADHALAVAREQGSWRQLEEAAMLGGTIALAEERWEDAEEHFTAGIEQAEGVGERGVAAIAYAARGFARMLQGRPEAAAPDNAQAREIFVDAKDRLSNMFHLGLAAVIAADRGDSELAQQRLTEARTGLALQHRELALWLVICEAYVQGPTAEDVERIRARLDADRASAFVRALAGHLFRRVEG